LVNGVFNPFDAYFFMVMNVSRYAVFFTKCYVMNTFFRSAEACKGTLQCWVSGLSYHEISI
jgi:hypothetical protein